MEVKIFYPTWRGRRISKTRGRHREVGSKGSVEQKRELMNKNLIGGVSIGRAATSPQSPISTEGAKRRPGSCALKAVELTSGGLCWVSQRDWANQDGDPSTEVSRGHGG